MPINSIVLLVLVGLWSRVVFLFVNSLDLVEFPLEDTKGLRYFLLLFKRKNQRSASADVGISYCLAVIKVEI